MIFPIILRIGSVFTAVGTVAGHSIYGKDDICFIHIYRNPLELVEMDLKKTELLGRGTEYG
jgi:hypothetical protein